LAIFEKQKAINDKRRFMKDGMIFLTIIIQSISTLRREDGIAVL